MKAETKAKYQGRLDACRKELVRAIQDASAGAEGLPEGEDRIEKLTATFNEVMAAQNRLMDGHFLNSHEATNTIQGLELKCRRLGLLGAAEGEGDETTVPNWNSPDAEQQLPDRATALMQKMTQAQQLLNDVYAEFVTEHPVMALVPAVDDLKQYTKNLNGIMQGLAKVGALL